MRRAATLIAGIIAGIGIGLLALGFLRSEESSKISESLTQTESTQTLALDSPAPDFELESLSRERVRLEDFRGRVVLLNFWAPWCGPCRLEMPAFEERFKEFAGDLQVVAVNFDEPQHQVQNFVDELGLSFEILLDPGADIQRLYQVRGYPTSYFVDAEGVVRVIHIGLMTEGQLDDYLVEMGLER